jgi:glycosyltransferase involved in cell wall biosynthesis
MKSLVIIPVYNEEETIREVLGELCHHYQGDVLIINDGSTDASMQNIHACIAKRPVTVINHETNLGYGKSLIDGFNYAINKDYQVAVTMDCDWQHQPQHVCEFLSGINDCDILSGSRYLKDFAEDTDAPSDRRSINQLITKEINAITGFKLTDSFCGFKSYKIEALKKLELDEWGYAFPIQFWVQAFYKSLTIKELAVARIYTGASRSFGGTLDDSDKRLKYYREVLKREIDKWGK